MLPPPWRPRPHCLPAAAAALSIGTSGAGAISAASSGASSAKAVASLVMFALRNPSLCHTATPPRKMHAHAATDTSCRQYTGGLRRFFNGASAVKNQVIVHMADGLKQRSVTARHPFPVRYADSLPRVRCNSHPHLALSQTVPRGNICRGVAIPIAAQKYMRVSSGKVRRKSLMIRPVSAASKLSSTPPGAATHSASSSSGAQVCPLPRFWADALSKRSSARFRVMRPRYAPAYWGRLAGILFHAASQVSFSHSSASWALCRMLSAILRQYVPNLAAVSASACSSRAPVQVHDQSVLHGFDLLYI